MVFSRLESYNYRPLPGIPGSSAFARFGAKAYKGIPRTWSLFQCQITMATLFPKSHPGANPNGTLIPNQGLSPKKPTQRVQRPMGR